MKYMGSKNRIAKHILPIILKDRRPNQWYIEPFCGGCNSIDKVKGNRLASDSHYYLIEMWKALQNGWLPPMISKDDYKDIRNNKGNFLPHLVGWVGFNCSYSGKWFGGFAGQVKTKINTLRDYQVEAHKNIKNQIDSIKGIDFRCCSYDKLELSDECIIYCDIPYANTTKYKEDFNHEKFWNWCRDMGDNGHKVFVSEYNAPDDFKCVWEKKVASSLSANGKIGGNKISTEKLFVLE